MRIRRFVADDVRQALQMVRDALGPDALILANRRVPEGVEIVSAIDYEEAEYQSIHPPISLQASDEEKEQLSSEPMNEQASRFYETSATLGSGEATGSVSRDSQAIEKMQLEINSLKELLKVELAELAWSDQKRKNPTQIKIIERLSKLSISNRVIRFLSQDISDDLSIEQAWSRVEQQIKSGVLLANHDLFEQGGVFAFVGTTGVGKTTTLAKLAAACALKHGPDQVAVITTDCYRIGAHEQLSTYAKILNLPLKSVETTEQLQSALAKFRNKKFVFIDTAGLSKEDQRLLEQQNLLLASKQKIKPILVLSSVSQLAVMMSQYKLFEPLHLHGCIVTKIDECLSLGNVISALFEMKLPMMFLTNGQRVPEDYQVASEIDLLSLAMQLATENPVHVELASAYLGGEE